MDDGAAGAASSHMTTHMSVSYLGRVEIVGGRRRWTVEQKLAMLADAFGPGGSVGVACDRYRVGSGQLYTWRRRVLNGELDGMKPAARAISEAAFAEVALPAQIGQTPAKPVMTATPGLIGIDLLTGVKLTVDMAVDADALAWVLSVLGR